MVQESWQPTRQRASLLDQGVLSHAGPLPACGRLGPSCLVLTVGFCLSRPCRDTNLQRSFLIRLISGLETRLSDGQSASANGLRYPILKSYSYMNIGGQMESQVRWLYYTYLVLLRRAGYRKSANSSPGPGCSSVVADRACSGSCGLPSCGKLASIFPGWNDVNLLVLSVTKR